MTSSWMLVAGFFFAAAGMFVKIGSTDFGAAELGFYRCIFTAVVAYAYLRATGGTVKSPYIGTHLLRMCRHVGATRAASMSAAKAASPWPATSRDQSSESLGREGGYHETAV